MPAGSGRAQLHRSRGTAGRPHATVTCKRLAQSALGLRLLTFRFGPLVQMPRRIPDPDRALVPSRRPKTEHTPKTSTPGPMSPPGPGKAPGSPGPHRRAPPRHTSRTPPSHLLRCPGPSWAPSPCRVGRGGVGGVAGLGGGRAGACAAKRAAWSLSGGHPGNCNRGWVSSAHYSIFTAEHHPVRFRTPAQHAAHAGPLGAREPCIRSACRCPATITPIPIPEDYPHNRHQRHHHHTLTLQG